MRSVRIAIFASGKGSNAMALIQKAKELPKNLVDISFVLSDQAEAGVIEKAKDQGVKVLTVPRITGKRDHEEEILRILQAHQIDWIFLAGYMRLLSPSFLKNFAAWHGGSSQVVNIHPSLLPAYPGVDSIKRAYEDQTPISGVTLHYVDEGMDTGKIIHQDSIVRNPSDSFEVWAAQFHSVEHRLYGTFLEEIAHKKVPTVYFEENP